MQSGRSRTLPRKLLSSATSRRQAGTCLCLSTVSEDTFLPAPPELILCCLITTEHGLHEILLTYGFSLPNCHDGLFSLLWHPQYLEHSMTPG